METAPRQIGNTHASATHRPATKAGRLRQNGCTGRLLAGSGEYAEIQRPRSAQPARQSPLAAEWSLFIAANVTDRRYAESASLSSGNDVYAPGMPRTAYLGISTRANENRCSPSRLLPLAGMALADAGGSHDMPADVAKSLAARAARRRRRLHRMAACGVPTSDGCDRAGGFPMISGSSLLLRSQGQRRRNIAADGENRPQLVFGPQGEIGVGWTQSHRNRFPATPLQLVARWRQIWSAAQTINDRRCADRPPALSCSTGGSKGLTAVWLDARDKTAAKAKKHDYRGSALYSAFRPASGRFSANRKLADYSCECCRVALALIGRYASCANGAMCFSAASRDHALQRLDGASPLQQVRFRPMADRRLPASWSETA